MQKLTKSIEGEEGKKNALGRSNSRFKGPGEGKNLMSHGAEKNRMWYVGIRRKEHQ